MSQIIEQLDVVFRRRVSEKHILRFKLSSLQRLLPFVKKRWKKALVGSLLMAILSLLALPSPYLMKLAVDKALIGKNLHILITIVLLIIALQIVNSVVALLVEYYFSIFSQEMMLTIKKELFYKLLRLPLAFFDKNQTGYVLSRLGEVDGLGFFFSNTAVRVLISFLEFLFCLVVLVYMNWRLTMVSLLLLPMYYIAVRGFSRTTRRLALETAEKTAVIYRQVQDALAGVEVIKSFTAESRETERLHKHLDEMRAINIRRSITSSFAGQAIGVLGSIAGVAVLWLGGTEIIKGVFTIGSYIAFTGYLSKLYGPTQLFATLGLAFQPATVALERTMELLDLATEGETKGRICMRSIERGIEFQNVYFSYDEKPVLVDLSFKINKGEKVLISGSNGSGKSTIVKLIMGMYSPQKGSVLFDGYDLAQLSLSAVRERISIVSQNTFLFNDSIRNNILYGMPSATNGEIEEVSDLTGVTKIINKLDLKYETMIGERGIRLSGGERQKLAIARAILKDSDVIIFDEATTHLDRESETTIAKLVASRFSKKTCIFISHRSSDHSRIDKIINLANGRATLCN